MSFLLHNVMWLATYYLHKPAAHCPLQPRGWNVTSEMNLWVFIKSKQVILYILPLKHLDTSLNHMMCMYTIKSIIAIQMAIDLMHSVGRTSSKNKSVCTKGNE